MRRLEWLGTGVRAVLTALAVGCGGDGGSEDSSSSLGDASAGSESSASTSASTTASSSASASDGSGSMSTAGSSDSTADATSADDSSGGPTGSGTESGDGSSGGSSGSESSGGGGSSSSGDESTGGVMGPCVPGVPAMPPGDCADVGISLEPPYDAVYSCLDLGAVPGVPLEWGGLVISLADPNIMLIGGDANEAIGQLYEVQIVRDANCHVIGFEGAAAQVHAAAEWNDGGLDYGPDDVLFLARWPVNEMGQLLPGAMATSKVIQLGALGVVSSPGGLTFVPPMFPGEGLLKAVSWPGGEWYTFTISPDGLGTYDLDAVQYETTIVGGPEAFVYIAAGNPEFPADSLLVAEWSAGNIAAYESDADGDPLPATRADFIIGLAGAESAYVDPDSGDFLFATFAGVERMIAVQGFMPQPQ